jgi:C_GCAxxG_C_C family probable redox protein
MLKKCEDAKATALAGYRDPGPAHLNCAQTVLLFGLLAMDQDPESIGLAGYLGGGMARMGETCGALSGAALTLGLRKQLGREHGSNPNETFDFLQQLFRDFETEFGTARCKELLGCDISTTAGFREAKRSQALGRCPDFVTWTIDRLAALVCPETSEG